MSWWCVAWSDDLKDKPVAVRVGADDIVLFRDFAGIVRACEDRCSHRRVPLSMGWVTSTGAIQCGYHGWTYSGTTGQCVAIPNFRPDEPISARVKVSVFETAEAHGAVFVEVGAEAEQAGSPPAITPPSAINDPIGGEAELDVAHAVWVERLIANPVEALGLKDFSVENASAKTDSSAGSIVVEKNIVSVAGQPLTARFQVWALTGFAQLIVRDQNGGVRMNVLVSSLPLTERSTRVRWCLIEGAASGLFASVLRKLRGLGASESINIRMDVARLQDAEAAILLWRNLRLGEQHLAHQIRLGEEG
jgi:nitrite reductase/ring-hydroxylating ferredoxin subunit